jgi:hypothetical protein
MASSDPELCPLADKTKAKKTADTLKTQLSFRKKGTAVVTILNIYFYR